MSKLMNEFERLNEWEDIAKKLVDKYPERWGHVDTSKLVAYVITNKENNEEKGRPYEMQTDKLPMRLSNQYDYFIWFKHPDDWNEKPMNIRIALVISALERIDPDKPFSIGPLDYKDQSVMLRTFGMSWATNPEIPDALKTDVKFKS